MGSTSPDNFDTWLDYVNTFAAAFLRQRGKAVEDEPTRKAAPPAGHKGGAVLLCSPHPDDEALTGALALRLAEDDHAAVRNIAITLGSEPARKAQRKKELAGCCATLGFSWRLVEEPWAFASVTGLTRGQSPAEWQRMVDVLSRLFSERRPQLVLLPHAADLHATHIGVHHLSRAALAQYTARHGCAVLVAETEYWHPLHAPNLLLGVTAQQVARLVAALARHRGEMARHPYHLREPARLMDNIRRGGELIDGLGSQAPDFPFGVLYRLSCMEKGYWRDAAAHRIIEPGQPVTFALLWSLFAGP